MVSKPLPSPCPRRLARGVTMIEVLVTMLVLAFALLGMAGLQARLQVSEFESYQRSQALLLLNDMANRIATNRGSAAAYITPAATPLGTGNACPAPTTTVVQRDLREWCDALQGAGEVQGANRLGAMVGGRGCVEQVGQDYLVTVAWQGLAPVAAPPASVACAAGSYNGTTGSACTSDRCRRAVTTLVRVAPL